jgi:LytS/YehU family sensor histidine kinase
MSKEHQRVNGLLEKLNSSLNDIKLKVEDTGSGSSKVSKKSQKMGKAKVENQVWETLFQDRRKISSQQRHQESIPIRILSRDQKEKKSGDGS